MKKDVGRRGRGPRTSGRFNSRSSPESSVTSIYVSN
jgi:RNA recognition motif-containing protein